jgi:hypothetical protein
MPTFPLCKTPRRATLGGMSRFTAALAVLGVILLFVLGLVFGLFLPRVVGTASAPAILNTTAILQQVQTLSQWVTVKYVLEKVVILDDAKWYGESKVTLVVHGVVKAGINLQALKIDDVRVEGQKITIKLPSAMITDVYLDDHHTEVLERTRGILRAFDKDLEQNARVQAVDEVRRAALLNGILQDANDRARTQLMNLLLQCGFKEVNLLPIATAKRPPG